MDVTNNDNDDNLDSSETDVEKETLVSALPDELLEGILLGCLPVGSILRAGSVCKRWNEIVSSRSFLRNIQAQKPWYFMFTSSDNRIGYAYDPSLRKWHGIDLHEFVTSNWCTASSCGLVCFMDSDTRSNIYVCNPITKSCKKLLEPPGSKLCDYSALAFSFYMKSQRQRYEVSVVKSKQVPENLYEWELSIHIYDSETMEWTTSLTEVLEGWRTGDESVICDGDLYFLIHSTQVGLQDNTRHGLIRYSLSNDGSSSHDGLLSRSFILAPPCALTCGRLMNLKDKLVMVGGIGKQDRADIIKGVGIWVLKGNDWQELARMPRKFLYGFGELDDVFGCGGDDDLIYIHSYSGPALVVFDINTMHFKWSHKCPVPKKFSLQLFTGFCFQPSLQTAP